MIVVATVPHTGSHFLLDLLDREEISVSRETEIQTAHRKGHRRVIFRHVYGGESLAIIERWGEVLPVVTPLRHPLACAQSWKNRGKPIIPDGSNVASMLELWRNMINLRCRPHYLPLDLPKREKYLSELRDITGQKLRTTWKRYGPPPDTNVPLTSGDKAGIRDLMRDPFFETFYGTTD